MVTSKTRHVKTLILGGGITGLSTAYALEQHGCKDYLLIEAKDHLGGLCATTSINGYHVDYGGHLLHVHSTLGKKLVKRLLGNQLHKHNRIAWIYTHGMRVPFPFQTNLWALYPELRDLLVEELKQLEDSPQPAQNFEDWCLKSFGYGLYQTFFRPYNEKLWGRPLTKLTCEWCTPFVPTPLRKEMLRSACEASTKPQGYNSSFYYPKRGGCGALINALSTQVSNVWLQASLTHIDLRRKIAFVNNRQKITFEQVVNTLPLPVFVELLEGHTSLKRVARQLEVQPITVYHLAIARKVPHFSWIYCPDPAQPFYRVGLASGFSEDCMPDKNASLFYIELPGKLPTTKLLETTIWEGLYQKGIVNDTDIKLFSTFQTIPYAYVIFNKKRAQIVPAVIDTLAKEHCFCAGRYGRWEYSFMESSLTEGWNLAQKLI